MEKYEKPNAKKYDPEEQMEKLLEAVQTSGNENWSVAHRDFKVVHGFDLRISYFMLPLHLGILHFAFTKYQKPP